MTLSKTVVQRMDGDVTCIEHVMDATAGGIEYLGTNKGNIYKYVHSTGVMTEVFSCDKAILSMNVYGDVLFVGLAGGDFAKLGITGYTRKTA